MEIHQHKVDLPKTFGKKTMVKHHPMPWKNPLKLFYHQTTSNLPNM
jgi:hypothetical protein